jgi:hypothetical protein
MGYYLLQSTHHAESVLHVDGAGKDGRGAGVSRDPGVVGGQNHLVLHTCGYFDFFLNHFFILGVFLNSTRYFQ